MTFSSSFSSSHSHSLSLFLITLSMYINRGYIQSSFNWENSSGVNNQNMNFYMYSHSISTSLSLSLYTSLPSLSRSIFLFLSSLFVSLSHKLTRSLSLSHQNAHSKPNINRILGSLRSIVLINHIALIEKKREEKKRRKVVEKKKEEGK